MGNPTLIRKFVGMVAYPPGSIYITVHQLTTDDLREMWGGTWEAFGAGQTLFGYNANDSDFNVVNKTGGRKDSVLKSHNHTFTGSSHSHSSGSHYHTFSGSATGGSGTTDGSGVLTTGTESSSHSHGTGGTTCNYFSIYTGTRTSEMVGKISGDVAKMTQVDPDGVWSGRMATGTESTTHTHTVPSHTHDIGSHTHSISGTTSTDGSSVGSATAGGTISSSGSSTSGNENLPPYTTVFMYKRLTLY